MNASYQPFLSSSFGEDPQIVDPVTEIYQIDPSTTDQSFRKSSDFRLKKNKELSYILLL